MFEKNSQSGFGVIHRVSDPQCEPTPNADEEAACEAKLDTDLSDVQWERIAPMIPDARAGGRLRKATSRELVHAVLYFLRAGSAGRLLPHEQLTSVAETLITIAASATLLRRWA